MAISGRTNVAADEIASYRITWDELGFRRQLGLPTDRLSALPSQVPIASN
jgi:hypothetical protein